MSDSVIVLEPPAGELKSCQPNLMPFHISYSGPANISTFMNVKPAKPSEAEIALAAQNAQSTSAPGVSQVKVTEEQVVKEEGVTESQEGMVVETQDLEPPGVCWVRLGASLAGLTLSKLQQRLKVLLHLNLSRRLAAYPRSAVGQSKGYRSTCPKGTQALYCKLQH